jgi:transcriptional regulator with XRE-family HTH domain
MNNRLSNQDEPDRNFADEFQDLKEIIAHNLCIFRKWEGLTQKQLGKKSGLGESTIKNIETARENITIETIVKLCVALNKFYVILVKEKIHVTV